MGKFILIVLIVLLFFSACSSENSAPIQDEENPTGVLKNPPMPIPSGVEGLKNPTPEGSCVYPEPAASPSEFKPVLDHYELKYIPAKKAVEFLRRLSPETNVVEGNAGNSLIIKGKPMDIWQTKDFIKEIDKPAKQIMIESKIIEISENGMKNLGFTYGNTAQGFKIAVDPNNGKIKADDLIITLNALVTNGEAKVIASPRIATLDNNEACVNIGSKIPYALPVTSSSGTVQWSVSYIDAGVSLKITPCLGENGMITVSINPEVSSVSEWRVTSAGEFPVISTRNASSLVMIKDGQTIAIGGLISELDRENVSKLPFIGDIPLLSVLFKKTTKERTKTDIVFLITPRVL